MSCCSKPTETTAASSCCPTTAPGACATEGKKCCPIEKLQCIGKCLGALVLRLTIAGFMLPFGIGKVFTGTGLGYGWEGTYKYFTENMHIPAPFAVIGILAEVVFPIMLILGLFTRFAVLGLLIQIIVAVNLGGHLAKGFMGTVTPEGVHLNDGFALHLLFGGACLALALIGPGKIALDSIICCCLGKKKVCCTK
jgi:putative oxidoreductase